MVMKQVVELAPQVGSSIDVNKMPRDHRRPIRNQQAQQRRKWSDWSECSASCLRTRHRTNCDDIIAASRAAAEGDQSAIDQEATKKQAKENSNGPERTKLESEATTNVGATVREEETEEELLLKADQLEEDDYADEADAEDEDDSCANVDASKTFEERHCVGGLCRLPSPQLVGAGSQSAATVNEQRKLQSSNHRLRSNQQRNKVLPAGNQSDPSAMDAAQAGELATPFASGSINEGSLNLAQDELAAMQRRRSSTSMWPLFADLGPQANLIQWTILIGSLLTVILLIMLILRKLFLSAFPSYHWMLAKQTLKSTGGTNVKLAPPPLADCCRHRRHQLQQQAHLNSLACAPGAHLAGLLVEASDSGAVSHQVAAPSSHHQVCFPGWHHSQQAANETVVHRLAAAGCGDQLKIGPRSAPIGCSSQYMVDSTGGSHLLAGVTFNTDQLTDRLPSYMEASSHTNASSGSHRGVCARQDEFDASSILSNYNYDTLTSAPVYDQDLVGRDGFVGWPTKQQPTVGGQQQNEPSSAPDADRQRCSLKCSSRQLALDEPSPPSPPTQPPPPPPSAGHKKHRSPNVPNPAEAPRDSPPPQLEGTSSHSNSISSSASIQSATAQMLSNAASFELQISSGELIGQDSPCEAPHRIAMASFLPANSSASASNSPSLGVVGKLRQKFAQIVPHESQSQPNSPMISSGHSQNRNKTNWPKRSNNVVVDKEQADVGGTEMEWDNLDQYDQPEILAASRLDFVASSRPTTTTTKGKDVGGNFPSVGLNCDTTEEDNMDKHFYEEITSQTQR